MEISRNVMLAQMEITEKDGQRVVHNLVFCKADGSLRKMRAMNHVKNPQGNHERSEGTRFKYNLKEKSALLLYDVEKEKPRTVLIDSILYFNGMEVRH